MTGTIIVTGGSRGIGKATALEAGKNGYDICINYNKNKVKAEEVAHRISEYGVQVRVISADVSDPCQVSEMFKEIDQKMPPIVALVNNAGVTGSKKTFAEYSLDEIHKIIGVNMYGTFHCIREVVNRISSEFGGNGGNIVNISTSAVATGGYRISPYVASKSAIMSLSTSLSKELAPVGIRVNTVSPGIIKTDLNIIDNEDVLNAKINRIPLGRFGESEEVAKTILFLLSKEASYINGANLQVTGGL